MRSSYRQDIHAPGFQSDYYTPFAHGVFDWITVSHEAPYANLYSGMAMNTYVMVFCDDMFRLRATTTQKNYFRQMLLCNPPIYVLKLRQMKCPCSSNIWTLGDQYAPGAQGCIFAPDGIRLLHLFEYIKRFLGVDRPCLACGIGMKTRIPRLTLVARQHALKDDDPVIEEGASKELRTNLLEKS